MNKPCDTAGNMEQQYGDHGVESKLASNSRTGSQYVQQLTHRNSEQDEDRDLACPGKIHVALLTDLDQ